MNTRNRITLLLAAIMVVALLVVGMTLTTSAADGDLVTEYGTVPAANANDNFAIFHKAEGATEYTFWASAANPFTHNSGAYQALEGEVVMLMLKDVDFSGQATVNLTTAIKSDLTIDLGGHTLIQSTSGTGTFNIYGIALSEDTVMNYTIKNGTITNKSSSKNNEVILVGHTEAALGYNLVTNLTLDHLTFTKVENTPYYEQNFVQVNNKPASASTMNILYNECVLDLTNISADAEKQGSAICSYRDTSKQVVYSEFRGGEIRVASMTGFTLINGSVDKVTFTEGENGYFKFVAPITETVPSWSNLIYDKENYGFGKVSQDDNNAYYTPVSLETAYATLSNSYASPYNYPFVIFTKAEGATEWSVHTTQANAANGHDPWTDGIYTKYREIDGEVVILMRRDVDFSARVGFSNGFRMVPTTTLDLNGFTLISSDNTEALFNFATKEIESYDDGEPREYIFKNGTVVTKDKPFMLFKASATIANCPTINVQFDNVIFDRAEGATKEQPFVQVGFVDEGKEFNANVVYNDCTFDVRGDLGSVGVYLFSLSSSHASITYKSLLHMTQTVNGGKILSDTTDNLRLTLDGRKNGSSIAFNKGSDGKLLELVLPNGVENTLVNGSSTSHVINASNAAYCFYKTSVGSENTTYQLCPYWLTQYIPKTSVTLSTDLIYNIYLPVSRYIDGTINGVDIGDLGVTEVTIDDVAYYHVAINGGLTTAGDELELVVTINAGGSSKATATRKISIVKYAKNLLASNPTEVEADLTKDMLAYVKAACVYANEKAETVAAINAIIGEDYEVATASGEAVQNVDGLSGAYLLLGDKPAFVFTTNGEYDASAYKFAIGDTTVKTEVDGNVIYVYTYAYAMTETVTYTIEGTEISGAYNLAAYLAHEREAGNADTVALVEALWQYSDAAKAYKAEQAA